MYQYTCSALYSYMYHYVNKLSNRNVPYMFFDVNFSRFHCHRLTYTIAVIMISWKYLALTIIIMFCAFWKFAVSIQDFYRKCSPQRLVHYGLWMHSYRKCKRFTLSMEAMAEPPWGSPPQYMTTHVWSAWKVASVNQCEKFCVLPTKVQLGKWWRCIPQQ